MNSDEVYEVLCSVRISPNRGEKERKLMREDSPLLRKVLEYALNPYKKYYMSETPSLTTTGTEQMGETGFRLLNVLSDRSLSGNRAKKIVKMYMSSLTMRSQELFQRILTKKLNCGISAKTVNKVFTGLVPDYQVMKAEGWDESRFIKGSYVGYKIDGIRATFRDGTFWTRSGRPISGLDYLTGFARKHRLGKEWDGELDIPGLDFNKASGIIRSHAHSKPGVRFTVFDLPLWDGGFEERYEYYYKTLYDIYNPMFRPLAHTQLNTVSAVLEMFKFAVDHGEEGVVIKSPYHTYVRKRCYDWMKMKLGETIDCRVFDYVEGKGKFAGMIGKLIVHDPITNHNHTIGVGKMTQEDQKLYFGVKNFRQLENGMVEVAYMEKTPSGDLRHGRFSKFLWDR